MLDEYTIEMLPEAIYRRFNKINAEYLDIIATKINEIGRLRATDINRMQAMYENGGNIDKITQKLADATGKSISDIHEIYDAVAKENYEYTKPFYAAKSKPFIPYEGNEKLQKYVRSLAVQTANEYVNLTQHTGFAVFSKGGKSIAPTFASNADKVATSLSDTYTKVLDLAVTKAQLGETDYRSAMREVIKAMSDSGIRSIDYATGYTRRLDSAVRQNVLWGIKQCNQNTADIVGEQFGADGYEISYHSNPRPSHADMGGRQYAIGEAKRINGVYYPSFSTVEPLLSDFGCLHFKFSIVLGISSPAYSKEQLAALKERDKQTFEYEGKEYNGYEATQVQRKLETAIRRQKERANMAKAAGDDTLRREAQQKINQLTAKYKDFSDKSGLPTKMERAQMSGFRKVKTKDELKKKVAKGEKSGIIKKSPFEEVETATSKKLKNLGIDYNPVFAHTDKLTTDEIIKLISGGDLTSGSCASVALAYAGQKQGWNVLDFRGGSSMDFFSSKLNKVNMFQDLGVKSIVSDSAKTSLTNGKRIFEQLNEGTEYYLSVGRHAAIVRKNNSVIQYLELQCSNPSSNGWKDFGDVAETLKNRFGCSSSSKYYSTAYATDISQLSGNNFRTILGYLNTDATSQRKGVAGFAK